MNLKQIKELFEIEYEIECTKRNIKPMVLPENLIYYKISEGISDISSKVGESQIYYDLFLQSGVSTYTLGENVTGKVVKVEVDGFMLQPMGFLDPYNSSLEFGFPAEYRVDIPAATDSKSITFYPKPGLPMRCRITLIPSYLVIDLLTENLEAIGERVFPLPHSHISAIRLFLLKTYFAEKEIEYEREVERLRFGVLSFRSIGNNFKYHFGV